jgi:diaminohydroxyphosphoribosylaminopyrimidine deaminase / 5-amino-6-(5-phosphoribosylamino)uracil reductase
MSDAILVGIGTVLSDNPQLTCRLPGMLERSPVRVVIDARLRVPLSTSVVATVRETPTWIVASRKTSTIAGEILEQRGCKVLRVDDGNGRLDLSEVLKMLADAGITRLMVEGGPTVAASFVAADLVDEAVLLYSEKLIGEGGIAPLEGMALDAINGHLRVTGSERLDSDTLERYERA